jgi:hypothetical protein
MLRADGTTVSQSLPPYRTGVSNAGWSTDEIIFIFSRNCGNDAIALVVNIGGQLYCHEIEMAGEQ